MFTKIKPALPQFIDPNMIAKALWKHFSVQLKSIDKPIYKKPYLEWVDKMMPLPRGYKVLDFTTFSRDDDKSTMEQWVDLQLNV